MLSSQSRRPSIVAAFLGAALVAMLLAGCGSSDSGGSGGSGASGSGKQATVQVGILQEDRPAAEPWASAMHDSVVKLQGEDPAVKVTEAYQAFNPTAAEPVARQFLTGGFGVVDFHSFALEDLGKKLAKEFPNVPMSVSSFSAPQPPNLGIETASYLQIGYANCWLLSKLSKSGKIAIVGGMPIPYATEMLTGCQLGAKAANPKVTVLSAYSNSFTDQQATLEQSQTLLQKGADGLFPASATEDSLGGFKLCEQKKVNCVGWAADAKQYAPNTAVGSVLVDWSVLLKSLVTAARAKAPKPVTFDATFANKGLVAPSSTLRVPPDVETQFEKVVSDLTTGKVTLPKSKAHPCCP
jgi:simple sugar transport system substrate-binding protein